MVKKWKSDDIIRRNESFAPAINAESAMGKEYDEKQADDDNDDAEEIFFDIAEKDDKEEDEEEDVDDDVADPTYKPGSNMLDFDFEATNEWLDSNDDSMIQYGKKQKAK